MYLDGQIISKEYVLMGKEKLSIFLVNFFQIRK